MKLSIVTTMYQSASHLEEFFRRVTAVAEKSGDDYEVVFVNDGSPDTSLDVSLRLRDSANNVRVVDLSRNFGHHKAIMTGLEHAKGEFVFLIDCDLEEPPELLEQFHQELLKHQDADVIYGVQKERKGGVFETLTGHLFYIIFNFLSDHPIPPNLITARLMTRRYVDNLLRHRESEFLIGGLWTITGFKQIPVDVKKGHKGSSSYSLSKKITLALDSVTTFSRKPLLAISLIGIFISLVSFVYIVYTISRVFAYGIPVPGYASILVSIWFLGGIIVFSVGVVGIYLSRVFIEVKNRPYTIVREIYDGTGLHQETALTSKDSRSQVEHPKNG